MYFVRRRQQRRVRRTVRRILCIVASPVVDVRRIPRIVDGAFRVTDFRISADQILMRGETAARFGRKRAVGQHVLRRHVPIRLNLFFGDDAVRIELRRLSRNDAVVPVEAVEFSAVVLGDERRAIAMVGIVGRQGAPNFSLIGVGVGPGLGVGNVAGHGLDLFPGVGSAAAPVRARSSRNRFPESSRRNYRSCGSPAR